MAFFSFLSPDMVVHPYSLYYNLQDNIFRPRLSRTGPSPYFRPSTSRPQGISDNRKIEINFQVGDLTIEEISVRISSDEDGRCVVTVVGHKNRKESDVDSAEANDFQETCVLPRECDISRIQSELSSDGVLTVRAPVDVGRIQRNIPILLTGEPARRGAVPIVNAKGG